MTAGMGVEDFYRAISRTLQRNPAATARAFGRLPKSEIASCLYEYCVSDIGAAPAEVVFMCVGHSGVLGLRMADKRAVVLKTQLSSSPARLARVYAIQEVLRQKGIPCAALVRAPRELRPGMYVVAHTLFAPGSQVPMNPAVRKAIASEYLRVVSLTEDLDRADLMAPAPMVDSELFENFPGLKDEVCRRWTDAEKKVVHTDWKLRNLLFKKDNISAIYDFDALQIRPDLQAVASTAVNFMRGRGPITVSLYPDHTYAFLRDYERARGKKFSSDEVCALRMWVLYDLIVRTGGARSYGGVPSSFITERIKRFNLRIGALWPDWKD